MADLNEEDVLREAQRILNGSPLHSEVTTLDTLRQQGEKYALAALRKHLEEPDLTVRHISYASIAEHSLEVWCITLINETLHPIRIITEIFTNETAI